MLIHNYLSTIKYVIVKKCGNEMGNPEFPSKIISNIKTIKKLYIYKFILVV